MALPKIDKLSEVLTQKFRIVKKGFVCVKSSYQHWLDKKSQVIMRYADEQQTKLERFDKGSKTWVPDDLNSYWYKEEKTGKNKNYLEEYQSWEVEFEKMVSVNVWDPTAKKKQVVQSNKFHLEIKGNNKYGANKKLLEAIAQAESLGKKMEEVYYKIEKDGMQYSFKVDGVVPAEKLVQDKQDAQVNRVDDVLASTIAEIKKNPNYSKSEIMNALITTYGQTPMKAFEILKEHFDDRQ